MNKLQKIAFLILLLLSLLMICFLCINSQLYSLANKSYFHKLKTLSDKERKLPVINRHTILLDNNRYMIFDKNQNPLVDEKFDRITPFNSDKTIFLVTLDKKQGLLDASGNYILPIEYQYISNLMSEKKYIKAVYYDKKRNARFELLFDGNYKEVLRSDTILKKGNYFVTFDRDKREYKLLNDNLKIINSFHVNPEILNNKYIVLKDGSEIALLDMNGNQILAADYKTISLKTEKNGITYFDVTQSNKKERYKSLHGIIDDKNNIIIPCLFDQISYVDNGFWVRKIIKKQDEKQKRRKANYITKWAKFDFDGNYIENADLTEEKTTPLVLHRRNYGEIIYGADYDFVKEEENQIPQRKIVNISKEKKINTEELLSLEEIETLKKELEEDIQSNAIYAQEKPKPEKQPLHKANYRSDFFDSKQTGKFTKLTCDLHPAFCKLSKNALSAKYCGKEGFYLSDKELKYGKYYFEFQVVNPEGNLLSRDTILSMIRFTTYKTATDAQLYKTSWKQNKADIRLSRYSIKSKDVIGIAVDMNNARVHTMVNGEWRTNPYSAKEGIELKKGKSYYPAFSIAGYNEILTVNFGRQPFKYKMPEGYRAIDK